MGARYTGRFAPSPTGPLHAGSLVAALASWLDARAHQGQWLVRIEDVDQPRCSPGTDRVILQQLADCGLHPDAPPLWQSHRREVYQQALDQLVASGLAYPCRCSRKAIQTTLQHLGHSRPRHGELIYPGTCRPALGQATGPVDDAHAAGSAWRLRTDIYIQNRPLSHVYQALAATYLIANNIHWHDLRLGPQQQDVAHEVGDFVLKRADDCFTYQLAVVVDDAAQGVTDVVRGEDLTDNTARQIWLQQCLGLPTPRYRHTPLVLGADGQKLSKQNGALALDTSDPLTALNTAAGLLGLAQTQSAVTDALATWVQAWPLYNPAP